MPTYVYKNLTTGDTFEVQQPITEPALTRHPESGEPVKRVVQPVGIAFKGSGFYVNDSRRAAPSGGGNSGGASSTETSSSSKPAGSGASVE